MYAIRSYYDLRFGDVKIKSTYMIDSPDFVACHKSNYVEIYDVLAGIKQGGTFLLNSEWGTIAEMENVITSYSIHYTKLYDSICFS